MRKFTVIFVAFLFLFGPSWAATAGPKDALAVFRLPAPPSYAKAAHVIRLAKKGDVRAQAYLGFMYQTGRGVPQHYDKAAYWYTLAADNGDGNAQFALGLLYNKGQGVPMDVIQAYKWLNLSASQSEGEVRDFKVRMRDSIAFKMSIAQVEIAQQLARDWYRAAHSP
jgi:TPR repeat protein